MITVKADGIEAVMAKFKSYSVSAQIGINGALEEWANAVSRDAKLLVRANSANNGALLNSIHPDHGNGFASVTASIKYAAYIEFGTRKFAASYVGSLPPDWSSYANTFKGKAGGSFKDMLLNIMQWCKDKGIDKKAAYPIARSILINGIRPRPFLYPSVNKNLPLLMQDIKAIFK